MASPNSTVWTETGTVPHTGGRTGQKNKVFITRTEITFSLVSRVSEPEPRKKYGWWAELCEMLTLQKAAPPKKNQWNVWLKTGCNGEMDLNEDTLATAWTIQGKATCRRVEGLQWSNVSSDKYSGIVPLRDQMHRWTECKKKECLSLAAFNLFHLWK